MTEDLRSYHIVTPYGCFTLRAVSGEAACEAFKRGIQLHRALLNPGSGIARWKAIADLKELFTSDYGQAIMPRAVIDDDSCNQLLVCVLDDIGSEQQKNEVCFLLGLQYQSPDVDLAINVASFHFKAPVVWCMDRTAYRFMCHQAPRFMSAATTFIVE